MPRWLALTAAASALFSLAPQAVAMPVPQPLSREAALSRAASLRALGRRLFFEPALSASGKMSCASCHDPAFGFTPPNARPVQMGGADGTLPGTRAVPTLKYLQAVPPFTEHYMGEESDGALQDTDNGPTGGLTWDGRVSRGRDQARIPLLSSNEMANAGPEGIAAHVLAAGYGPALQRIFGAGVTASAGDVMEGVTEALEDFQQDPKTFFPYSSKFDAVLNGRAKLSAQEARGLAAFEDPARGNCAVCHRDGVLPNGGHPDFTDFGMIAVGVPRNAAIPANRDPAYFDLGLCGAQRKELSDPEKYCGAFKTPTLRNAALKQSFFHNGLVHSLRAAVAFYAERESAPEKWYPRGAEGQVVKYDDLPARFHGHVNMDAPFGRKPGEKPALSEADVDNITAFIETLTDGYAGGATDRGLPARSRAPLASLPLNRQHIYQP